MTEILSVSSSQRREPRLRLGAASLPSSFRYAEGDGEVVGLVGDGPWVARALDAIRAGTRGILVVDPVAADVDPLRQAAQERDVAIVLDRGWASSPAVRRAASEFAAVVVPAALVESRLDQSEPADLRSLLLRHVALVRAAAGAVTSLRLVRCDATGYDAVGAVEGGAEISLSGVVSAALRERATVRVVRPQETVLLELGPIGSAAPGRLHVLRGETVESPLLPYETPHRAAWRRLHAAVGEVSVEELDAFADDVRVVSAAQDPKVSI